MAHCVVQTLLEIHGRARTPPPARVKAKLEACQLDLVAASRSSGRTRPTTSCHQLFEAARETVTELEDTFVELGSPP